MWFYLISIAVAHIVGAILRPKYETIVRGFLAKYFS